MARGQIRCFVISWSFQTSFFFFFLIDKRTDRADGEGQSGRGDRGLRVVNTVRIRSFRVIHFRVQT